ncbi:MAG TPA: type II glyceraldehyde-3-phosphate dehydrogenase [Thermoplasmata archaeon]
MVVRVAINGYGTIGKRVADAVAKQSDMRVVGVAKTRPSHEARTAIDRGFPLFVGGAGQMTEFGVSGLPVAGTVAEMLEIADVVVDATPDKLGRENLALYDAAKVRVVFQGGEKADVAEVSFNALANYEAARGRRKVRVVSCNTTGLARAAAVLTQKFGVDWWDATIVRRAADPGESKKGPINGILPTFKLPSHHGADVRTIFPDLAITTTAVVVPTTLMHVHVNHLRFTDPPKDTHALVDAFHAARRIHVFEDWERVDGTPQVMEYARDQGNHRGDMMENVVWAHGVRVEGNDAYFFQGIHQESIVVPENVDAIRAMFDLAPDGATSMAITDKSLGIGRG